MNSYYVLSIILLFIYPSQCCDKDDLLAKVSTILASKMYKGIRESQPNKENFVFSPFSFQSVMSYLESCSSGQTRHQLDEGLNLPDTRPLQSEYGKEYKTNYKLTEESNTDFILKLATKLYMAEDIKLNEQCTSLARDIFGVKIENITFSDSFAANKMNIWVKDKLSGDYGEIVKDNDIYNNFRAILICSLRFSGTWPSKFKNIGLKPFYKNLKDTDGISVPFIAQYDTFNYKQLYDIEAELVQIPFKTTKPCNNVSMVIVLPVDKDGLETTEQNIEKIFNVPWENVSMVLVEMPKFNVTSRYNLVPILQHMNITAPFTSMANFSEALETKTDFHIDFIGQKEILKLDENGVNSNNAIENDELSSGRSNEILTVDHPFLCYIMWNEIVLLVARIGNLDEFVPEDNTTTTAPN